MGIAVVGFADELVTLGCVDISPKRLLDRLLYKAFRANLRSRVTA